MEDRNNVQGGKRFTTRLGKASSKAIIVARAILFSALIFTLVNFWEEVTELSAMHNFCKSDTRTSHSDKDGENLMVTEEKLTKSVQGNKFVLYRLIGNNMPPLQCPSQLLWNTVYTLQHESQLPGCKKKWIINQILNATERGMILDALLANGYSMKDIIVRRLNMTLLAETPQKKWVDMVTAQNEARNVAIEDGIKSGYQWILPFDGNHFITTEAWESITHSAAEAERHGFKYFKVPVHRLHTEQNLSWFHANSKFDRDLLEHAPQMIESQLAFRSDAEERFQEGMVYGKQNKLELLARVCGSPSDPDFVERCQCTDLGQEGQLHKSNVTVAKTCGYSIRLWFYPCEGTDPHKIFYKGLYRKHTRTAARRELLRTLKKAVRGRH